MLIKINKNYSIKIYFNQIHCCLLLNGRLLQSKSIKPTKFKMFINFLYCLSLSVNIINKGNKTRNNRKRKIISNKLLLKISNAIKRNIKDKYQIDSEIGDNKEKISKQQNINILNIFNSKKSVVLISIGFIIILIFFYDYKSIETKINQANYYEIKKIESDYKINKCAINGELPSLKQKCELMLSQIELLKNKKPSLLSVFFIWLLDLFNSYFTTFSLINCIITIIFIIIFYKLLR